MVHEKPLVDMGNYRCVSCLQDLSFNSLLKSKTNSNESKNNFFSIYYFGYQYY